MNQFDEQESQHEADLAHVKETIERLFMSETSNKETISKFWLICKEKGAILANEINNLAKSEV